MVINRDTGKVLVRQLKEASTFWSRFLGLLPYKELRKYHGLLLTPCKSVHTLFMRFSIDVLYLDSSFRVVGVYSDVKPWRILPFNRHSRYILEIPPGTIATTQTELEHCLKLVPGN